MMGEVTRKQNDFVKWAIAMSKAVNSVSCPSPDSAASRAHYMAAATGFESVTCPPPNFVAASASQNFGGSSDRLRQLNTTLAASTGHAGYQAAPAHLAVV